MKSDYRKRVAIDPKVMAGKPVIRGTRVPVDLILRMLGQGIPESDILAEYPHLESEDIRAALGYAAEMIAEEEIFPFESSAK